MSMYHKDILKTLRQFNAASVLLSLIVNIGTMSKFDDFEELFSIQIKDEQRYNSFRT